MDDQEPGTGWTVLLLRIESNTIGKTTNKKQMNPNDILLYSSERFSLAADGKFYGDP